MNEQLRIELLKSLYNFRSVRMDLYYNDKISMNDMLALNIILACKESGDESAYFSKIQDFMKISKPAVSQMLGSMEKRGLIEREIDPNDKRKFVMTITDNTKKEMNSMKKEFNTMMDEVVSQLGVDDTKEVIRLFDKMAVIAQEQKEKRRR